jgi:hypothetical protein
MMNARTTRRSFLGAVMGAVGLLGAGRLNGALADKNLNHGDKASFKSSCDQYGGEFVDSPKDKVTVCVWSDGGKTVCDGNGNDCDNYPPPKKAPGQGPWGDLPDWEITEVSEFESADPVVGPRSPDGGHAKRRRKGKRRKK